MDDKKISLIPVTASTRADLIQWAGRMLQEKSVNQLAERMSSTEDGATPENTDLWSVYEPTVTNITSGLLGSEGPVFVPSDPAHVYMVAPEVERDGKPAGQIIKVHIETQRTEMVCAPSVDGYGGIPAGCQADPGGNIHVADMRLGLLRVNLSEGTFEQVCKKDSQLRPMQGCNDCAYDYHGNLWITAPAGHIAPAAYMRSMQEPFGSVYCYTTEKVMTRVDTGYKFPNGIAVQHDREGNPVTLIVAETGSKCLWSFPFDSSHRSVRVVEKKLFGKCPGQHEGGPDGMDFDDAGNLLVANWGSGFIDVFGSSGGSPHTRIRLPYQRPSNLHFRPGSNEVYVTEHDKHGLWLFRWKHRGAKQYCDITATQ